MSIIPRCETNQQVDLNTKHNETILIRQPNERTTVTQRTANIAEEVMTLDEAVLAVDNLKAHEVKKLKLCQGFKYISFLLVCITIVAMGILITNLWLFGTLGLLLCTFCLILENQFHRSGVGIRTGIRQLDYSKKHFSEAAFKQAIKSEEIDKESPISRTLAGWKKISYEFWVNTHCRS